MALDCGVKGRFFGKQRQTEPPQVFADLLGVYAEMRMDIEKHDNARVFGDGFPRASQNMHIGAFNVDLDGVYGAIEPKLRQ